MGGTRRGWLLGSNLGFTAFNLVVFVGGAAVVVLFLVAARIIEKTVAVAVMLPIMVVMGVLLFVMTWYRKTGRI